MGWILGLVAFVFIAGCVIFKTLDTLSRIPPTKFGVMLIISGIFPMYIILKSAFTDASDEDQIRDWNIYGVILLLTFLVGVLSLFFD